MLELINDLCYANIPSTANCTQGKGTGQAATLQSLSTAEEYMAVLFRNSKIIIQPSVYSLRAESTFLLGTLDFHKLISDHVPATDQQGWGKSLLCNSKATLFK